MKARTRTGNPQRAVGYTRTSTDRQELSPEGQRTALEQWCAQHNVELVAVHHDTVSGGSELEARGGLHAALGALREHDAGLLLVHKRDRIARDVGVAVLIEREVMKCGAQVVSADGTANGNAAHDKLMRVMLDGFAAFERDMIRDRTVRALAVKRAKGERTSYAPPLGSTFVRRAGRLYVAPDPAEQDAIAAAQHERARGLSYRDVAARLTAEGYPTRSGKPWHRESVRRMLLAADAAVPEQEVA